jgi:signal recognition particle receptor subunit beta
MMPVLGTRISRQISFVGPFGVGKTTAVATVADGDVTTTEVKSSALRAQTGRHLKSTTTVGLEIGEWRAPDGKTIAVVGTPGQERFDVVRRSAMPRSAGVVLWLFGHHEAALLDAELWLEFIAKEVPTNKLTVAVTRLPGGTDDPALSDFRAVVDACDEEIPLIVADPRDRSSVADVLVAALRLPAMRTEAVS